MPNPNHQTTSGAPAAPPDDAWLEALLREDAAATPYLGDDGFTASVLDRLPPQGARSLRRWIIPAMGIAGFLIGLVWLSGGEALTAALVSLAQLHSVSLETILAAALPLGVLYWLAVSAAWQET